MATTLVAMSSAELAAATTFAEIQAAIRSGARHLLAADGATFVLRDRDQCFYVDEDAIAPLWKGQRFPMTHCISGWAMLHRESAVVPDIRMDDRIPLEAYVATFVRSLVMVPIRRRDPIGAIGVYWGHRHTATRDEVALLEALAVEATEAIGRVGLESAPWAPTFETQA
jgi:hypothetical protein